jgi:hypothetical protein
MDKSSRPGRWMGRLEKGRIARGTENRGRSGELKTNCEHSSRLLLNEVWRERLHGVRRLVGALVSGGLAPRFRRGLNFSVISDSSPTKLRLVAAGQSADNRGPRRGSRAGVAWRRPPRLLELKKRAR